MEEINNHRHQSNGSTSPGTGNLQSPEATHYNITNLLLKWSHKSFSFPLKHPTTQWFVFYFLQPHRTNSFLLICDSLKNIAKHHTFSLQANHCQFFQLFLPRGDVSISSLSWILSTSLDFSPFFDVSPTSSIRTEWVGFHSLD